MVVLEIPREIFINLLKDGNLIIFKGDIKLSNFVEDARDREMLNGDSHHDSGCKNFDIFIHKDLFLGVNQDPN